jgi:hypothetical protein
MPRRLAALVLLLVFAAGPAAQARCVLSCAFGDQAPAPESCHSGSSPDQVITQGNTCVDEVMPVALMAPRAARDSHHFTVVFATPPDGALSVMSAGRRTRVSFESRSTLSRFRVPLRI